MTPQELVERAARQEVVEQVRRVRVLGPAARALLESRRAVPLLELLSHPDQRAELQRFRYGHILGSGLAGEALADWQGRKGVVLARDVVALLEVVDGIHLWADLDTGRAYFGIRPLDEWLSVAEDHWGWMFEEQGGLFVISYHDNSDYFLVLDTNQGEFVWYDPQDYTNVVRIGKTVEALLEWWWDRAQELHPDLDTDLDESST